MGRVGRPPVPVEVTVEERAELERRVRARHGPRSAAIRAAIVLGAADGLSSTDIAAQVGVSTDTVAKWRSRFTELGLAGLKDAYRSGAPKRIDDATVTRIVETTRFERPPDGSTHWTTRTMAAHSNVSQATVTRVWNACHLKPHLEHAFKLSTDPLFIDKVIDVVGLYMNPPEHAVVLCADEKSQIQALQRTQPGQPVAPGHPATRTHDYVRGGTTTLFAAFDIVTGNVIHDHHDRHRAQEWLDFLVRIDHDIPAELDIHLVCDNYDTHKTAEVREWLEDHPRFHLHFTPTSASWLNQVERWFSLVQNKIIARGDHADIAALRANLDQWIGHYNTDPKPFVWTKSADNICEKFLKIQDRFIRRTYDSGH